MLEFRPLGIMPAVCVLLAGAYTAICVAPAAAQGSSSLDLSASAIPEDPSARSQPVARVNDEPIPYSVVESGVAQVTQGKTLSPEALASVQAAVLQRIIEQKLFNHFVQSQNIQVTKQEVEAAAAELRRNVSQQMRFDEFLARQGLTEAALRAQLAQSLVWEKYLAQTFDDAAVETFYNQVREHYDGTQRRVSHILFRPTGAAADKALEDLGVRAKGIRDAIDSGKMTFEQAAQRYSAGPSRRNGGDLGYMTMDTPMVQGFTQAVFALKPGDISDPMASNFGLHLIKVTDVKPGNKTWKEVREKFFPAFSQQVMKKVVSDQLAAAKLEFALFPHYKPGTNEIVVPRPPAQR